MASKAKSMMNVNLKDLDKNRSSYGSIQDNGTPIYNTPPDTSSVSHNLRLSNIIHLNRHQSEPVFSHLPSPTSKRIKHIYESTIHSPYFRTLSPRIVTTPLTYTENFPLIDSSTTPTPEAISASTTPKHSISEDKKVGVWGAGFSIINLFLGLGLLSFPYALAEGSFMSLVILALTCFFMSYTGKLIVRCFQKMPENERTYHQVGYRALNETFCVNNKPLKLGNFGVALVTFGILFEFIGGLCMSIIFIWDNLTYLAPNLELKWIIFGSSLALLPTCWMLNVSELAFNAFLGCICKVFTVSVIVITFFLNTQIVNEQSYDLFPTNPQRFSISIGIFILSYAGHACLPEIYTSMKEPHRFEHVLDVCFVIMFFTYSGMALFGYLQYGKSTAVIITANLLQNEGNKIQIIVAKVIIALVIASCYFQVSPILSVIGPIPEHFMKLKSAMKKRVFRTVLFFVIVYLSYCFMNHLALLEAITGSVCTTITSVICPSLFYFGLNRKNVSWMETVVLISYMVGGCLLGCFLLYNDIMTLIHPMS